MQNCGIMWSLCEAGGSAELHLVPYVHEIQSYAGRIKVHVLIQRATKGEFNTNIACHAAIIDSSS